MRPIAPPLFPPLLPVPEEEGEVPLRYTSQPERGGNLEHKTYVEVEEETEEEKAVVVPVMLNCWDWERMLIPVVVR